MPKISINKSRIFLQDINLAKRVGLISIHTRDKTTWYSGKVRDKFAVFFFTLIIAIFAQSILKTAFGWSPEFVMSALVIAGFYLSILEMAALSALGIFILNWRPFIDWEILLFFLLPFIVMYAKKIFPWRSSINGVLGTILSTAIFYAISNFGAIISNLTIFAEILAATAVFSAVLFQIINYFYKTH